MINSVSLAPQTVAAGNNVLFAADRVRTHACRCNCGWLEHDAGSGLYTLTKAGVYICPTHVGMNRPCWRRRRG